MMEKSLSSIADNIARIRHNVEEAALSCGRNPSEIRLMAVTKTVPAYRVNEAIAHGVDLLGENRAQELIDKYEHYNREQAEIHFIGHLQSNKVKYLVDRVNMIHSVDSLKLALEINRLCQAKKQTMNVLVEVNIGEESSKSGVTPDLVEPLIREIAQLPALKLQGLMTIPPISENTARLEGYFYRMQTLMVDMRGKNIDNINMSVLSMGMSDDYVHAIRYGANIIRLGSAIFGDRG